MKDREALMDQVHGVILNNLKLISQEGGK